MVSMSLLRKLVVAGLVLLAGCRLEDHTPAGSRLDEAQIREVLFEFYRGLATADWGTVRNFFAPAGEVSYQVMGEGDSLIGPVVVSADSALLTWARQASGFDEGDREARIVRADLRQADGVAAVWVTLQLNLPFQPVEGRGGNSEEIQHVVLHRTAQGWRIVLLSLPWTVR